MAKLKADSPLCRRIVPSFLDFLNSVEPSSVSDKESLKVAIACLSEAFKIDSSSTDNVPKSDSLVQIFSSQPDQNDAVIIEEGVSHVSSTVDDSDSKPPEAFQTLNAAGMKEKGVDKDPEVVESSSKKMKKKKNKNGRRKNKLEEPLKNTDSDSGASSSQNSENYPRFNLDDYLFARDEDLNMMKMMNEYNRRNHAIIKSLEYSFSYYSGHNDTDQNAAGIKEKGINKDPEVVESSTVNDAADSKPPDSSQTLNAAVMKDKGVDKDPEVVESSSKKKKKKKNKNGRRKNQSEVPLKNNTDSDNGGSSSQNSGNYPKFNLDDYPFAREEDRNMMRMMNEYNRRNHAIISEQGFDGVSDRQLGNFSEYLKSVGQMLGADSIQIKKKIWCSRCHQSTRRCGCL